MASKKRKRTKLMKHQIAADRVVVQCVRVADVIGSTLSLFFAEHGLTVLQFNVLRILYVQDAGREGLPTGYIASRLLTRGPDVTRLVDRLLKLGLVERIASAEDRRVVRVRLTDAGFDLVESVHDPLMKHNRALFAGVAESDLERLAELLEVAGQALSRNAP